MKKSVDFISIFNRVEKYSPAVAKTVMMKALNVAIPFNSHLKSDLKLWSDKKTIVSLKLRRGVKNHLGGVHAGALFTVSESAAGILLIRNFNPNEYRLILQIATIEYFKQAREACEAVCEISEEDVVKIKKDLKSGEPFTVDMLTKVQDSGGVLLCTLRSKWQIKPWAQVKVG